MNQVIRECEKGEAIIVYFFSETWRWHLPSIKEIELLLSNVPTITLDDGVIYGLSALLKKDEHATVLDRVPPLSKPAGGINVQPQGV